MINNRHKMNIDYSLYLVTDRHAVRNSDFITAIQNALIGGCTMVQLREKDTSGYDFYTLAVQVKKLTDHYHVPLIINDRIDIALAVNAAGVHIGQHDMPAIIARKLLGKDKLLGVSVTSVKQAQAAMADGADYIGVGAMFPTNTKKDACIVTMAELRKIRAVIPLPIVIIGGIDIDTIPFFQDIGINGLALISAILSQPDIRQSAAALKQQFIKCCINNE